MCVTNTTNRRPQALALAAKLASSSPAVAKKLYGALGQTLPSSDASSSDSATASSDSAFVPARFPRELSYSYAYDDKAEAPVAKRPKRKRKAQKPGKTAKMNDRHFVVHNYHDHAKDESDENDTPTTVSSRRRRGGVATSFPLKLHSLLDQIEQDGLAHVISWQPHGRAFVVHKPKEFVNHVMPKYFRQTKITSFQRQLNLYGFCRLTKGRDNRGYYHELFLRGKPFLCKKMIRTKVKGTGFKAASSPDQEPDFYKMPPVTVTPPCSGVEEDPLETSNHTNLTNQSPPWFPTQSNSHVPTSIQFDIGPAAAATGVAASRTPSMQLSSVQPFQPFAGVGVMRSMQFGPGPPTPPVDTTGDPILDEVVQDLFLDDVGKDDVVLDFMETWNVGEPQPPIQTTTTPTSDGLADIDVEDDMKLGSLLERFMSD